MKQKKRKKHFIVDLQQVVTNTESVHFVANDYEDAVKIANKKSRIYEFRRGEFGRFFSVDTSDWSVSRIKELDL